MAKKPKDISEIARSNDSVAWRRAMDHTKEPFMGISDVKGNVSVPFGNDTSMGSYSVTVTANRPARKSPKAARADRHPGFKAVQQKIESEGYTPEQAGAILSNKTRNASAAAKKRNPRLKKVKG